MTKLSRKIVDPEKFGHYVNNLWSAFTLMDSKEDIRLLFKDLFTQTEYKMFAKRLEIARRLLEGESYLPIQTALSVTSGTVGRVSDVLAEKGEGVRLAHKKLSFMEEKFLQKQKDITDNMTNPGLQPFKRHYQTVGGALIKAGIIELDKTISRKLKQKTAKKDLPQ